MIPTKIDWLLDPCYAYCFVCGKPFAIPPNMMNGHLHERHLCFFLLDEDGEKQETEERLCKKCWAGDLSQFDSKEEENQSVS